MAGIDSFENKVTYIVVSGVKMTKKEYLKYKKEKNAEIFSKLSKKKQREITKAKREAKKKRETEITILPGIIKDIVKNAGPIKSLAAYYDNAYRQWGTIATTILTQPEIQNAFVLFRKDAYELEKHIEEINKLSKKNSKNVFAYIEMLSWSLDNTKTKMKSLYDGVIASGVIEKYMDKECISGEGRRLGLRILMFRTFKSLDAINNAVKKLSKIVSEGVSVDKYSLETAYAKI
jgi:glycerol-3-phosphate responsive antiterminator